MAAIHSPEAAKRSIALEAHTVAELTSIIHHHDLSEAIDYVSGGHLVVLLTEEEIKEIGLDYAAAKLAGVDLSDVKWIDNVTMWKTQGTPFSGVWFPGGHLWPLKLANQLFLIAEQASSKVALKLHTRTPVTSVTPSSRAGRKWDIQTHRGVVSASVVLHATNAYASHLLPSFTDEIIPSRGQVCILRQLEGMDC